MVALNIKDANLRKQVPIDVQLHETFKFGRQSISKVSHILRPSQPIAMYSRPQILIQLMIEPVLLLKVVKLSDFLLYYRLIVLNVLNHMQDETLYE